MKKGISPVVATALLLVVAVVATVGFNSWFSMYQSLTLSGVEQSSQSNKQLTIDTLVGNTLYLRTGSSNISSIVIRDSQGINVCDFTTGIVNNSGLVGWWTLDDGNATIRDKSGLNNHGRLYGSTRLLLDFDRNTGGVTYDKTNYGNNGTVVGATWKNMGCVSGGCYDFDGSLNKNISVSISNSLFFNGTSSYSISFWVNGRAPVFNASYLICKWSSGAYPFCVQTSISPATTIWAGMWNGSISNGVTLPGVMVSSWKQVVVVFDLSNKKIYGYLDGIKLTESNIIFNLSSLNLNNDLLHIGNYRNIRALNGSIDEIAIYSKALSESEVQDLYLSQKANFIEFIDTPLGKGIEFDGRDNYVRVPQHSSFNFGVNNNFSILVTFNTDINNRTQQVMTKGISNGTHTRYPYKLELPSTGGLYFASCYSGTSFATVYLAPVLLTKRWYSTMFIKNSSTYSSYLNGVFVSSNTSSLLGIDNNVDLYFGTRSNLQRFFDGVIEEVRIYNRPLSNLEISTLSSSFMLLQKESQLIIDTNSCNLIKGQRYEVSAISNLGTISKYLIAK